jgi:hypothetical protein
MTDLAPGTILTLGGSPYMVQDSGAAWSLAMPSPGALTFEVQPGDHWGPDPTSKNRSEVAMQTVIPDGQAIDVSYDMQVAPGAANTAAFCMLGQFHQAQGTAVSGLGPPFSIGLTGEHMMVSVAYTDATGADVTKTIYVDPGTIVRGHSYAMDVRVTFGPDGSGQLTVTRDGLTLVTYSGPLGYQGEGGVYWKEGIYRAASPETMAATFADLAIATGTATASPGPGVQSYTGYDDAGRKSVTVTLNHDGSTTTTRYASTGAVSEVSTLHTDGAHDVYDYGVTGRNYVSDHRVYDTAGALTQFVAVAADGGWTVTDYAGNGSPADQLTFNYAGTLLAAVHYNADGSVTTDTYNGAGAQVQYSVVHPGGAKDIYDYGITGQSYVSDHRVYNPAGLLTEFVGTAADGSRFVDDYGVSGRSFNADQLSYNAKGILISAVFDENNGSTVTDAYAATGSLLQEKTVFSDGARDIFDYGISGQSYVADHRVYSAGGTLTLFATTGASGAETVTAYAGGLQLAGGAGNDVLNAFAGDTLVFTGSFGRDVVQYFRAGDATGHDVLEFARSAVADLAHLAMAQAGANVVITIDPHDTVTLANTKLAALTAHDFLFV